MRHSRRQKPDTDKVNDSLFSVLLMLMKKIELKIKIDQILLAVDNETLIWK